MKNLRVGIVGARGDFGSRVRELMEQRGVSAELKLFDSPDESGDAETRLTQFQEDVVPTQPFDPDLLERLDLLFIDGEDQTTVNDYASRAAHRGTFTIVTRSLSLGGEILSPHQPLVDQALESELVLVPRPSSWLVGSVASHLAALGPIRSLVATVIIPSGIWGEAATEELHQQLVQMLNFQPFPAAVFGEQIAFNASPGGHPDRRGPWREAVNKEVRVLSDLGDAIDDEQDRRVSIFPVQVTMFHGHAASIWVEFVESQAGANESKLYRHFGKSDAFSVAPARKGKRKDPTPATVAESDRIHLGCVETSPVEGPAHSARIWAVSSSLAYDPALRAVELALARFSEDEADDY